MTARHYLATGLLALAAACASAQDAPAACLAPHEVRAVHLYGAWRASWSDATGQTAAVLQLGRHPELAESVRGQVERDGITALVAGDVDDGDLTLEESRDGRRISANWIGRVVEGGCGKQINGVWTDADTGARRDFVLRRQGGWQ